MADWPIGLIGLGYTQICVARGNVSWGSEDDAAGVLGLWYRERDNDYYLHASKTAGDDMGVCKLKLLMFYS